MIREGDRVYIFGNKELSGKIIKDIGEGDFVIRMDKGRWWFGGENKLGNDMHVRAIVAYEDNLELIV